MKNLINKTYKNSEKLNFSLNSEKSRGHTSFSLAETHGDDEAAHVSEYNRNRKQNNTMREAKEDINNKPNREGNH